MLSIDPYGHGEVPCTQMLLDPLKASVIHWRSGSAPQDCIWPIGNSFSGDAGMYVPGVTIRSGGTVGQDRLKHELGK